jgi:hypothetical protein
MIRKITLAVLVAGMSFGLAGCSTSKEGVKSGVRGQYADVNATVPKTTEAAKSVFATEGLKEVVGDNTMIDGKVTGKKTDGTVITADVKKVTDTTSQVTVTVGMMGTMGGGSGTGTELAAKIKAAAEAP